MSSSAGMTLFQLAAGLSSLASLGGAIFLVVIVSTVVRRQRPDAWRGLLAWSSTALAGFVLSYVFNMLAVPMLWGSSGIDDILAVRAVATFLSTLVHVTVVLLLARGLVKLAQPPKAAVIPAEGAYR